jgi:hypothetical protein
LRVLVVPSGRGLKPGVSIPPGSRLFHGTQVALWASATALAMRLQASVLRWHALQLTVQPRPVSLGLQRVSGLALSAPLNSPPGWVFVRGHPNMRAGGRDERTGLVPWHRCGPRRSQTVTFLTRA